MRFECSAEVFVGLVQLCNGVDDCGNGLDEVNILCESESLMHCDVVCIQVIDKTTTRMRIGHPGILL